MNEYGDLFETVHLVNYWHVYPFLRFNDFLRLETLPKYSSKGSLSIFIVGNYATHWLENLKYLFSMN